ncbi:MAG: hypothetical protein NC401_11755 [Ruminococcus sp.]|nr:hypothetical protein [Ruminococcus sp.]
MSEFEKFLQKSEEMRGGYIKSLEPPDKDFREKWLAVFSEIPAFFEEIFTVCDGTRRDISEQIYFDFLPGVRLMRVDDIIEAWERDFKGFDEYGVVIPFLEDYGGEYYAYALAGERECVVSLMDGELEEIHYTVGDFWKTVIAFYDEGVYFPDEDGWLSYDEERESEVGSRLNEKISYWKE